METIQDNYVQEKLSGALTKVSICLANQYMGANLEGQIRQLIDDPITAIVLLREDPRNYYLLSEELKRNRVVALYTVSEMGYISTDPHTPGLCFPMESNQCVLVDELYHDQQFMAYYHALERVGIDHERTELMTLVDKSVEFYQHTNKFPNAQIFQIPENVTGYVRRINNAMLQEHY